MSSGVSSCRVVALFAALLVAALVVSTAPALAKPLERPDAGPSAPSPTFVDGALGGGNPRFFFLPPLVPEPEPDGAFDASAAPTVEVCLLDGDECAGEPVATFEVGDGLGVDPAREHYLGFWRPHDAERGEVYRLRVLANDVKLGYLDATVVRGLKEARDVHLAGGVPMFERLPFPVRFRVEEGLVTSVVVEPPEIPIEVGSEARVGAAALGARGGILPGREAAWHSDAPDVATVDGSGAITGVSPGEANVTASADGFSDSVKVTVTEPPPPEEGT